MQILQSKNQDQIENATAMGLLFQAGPSIKLGYLNSSFKSESRVVLICIFLMNKVVEHFFKCFSIIPDSSVDNSLISPVPHSLIELFGLLVCNFLSSL